MSTFDEEILKAAAAGNLDLIKELLSGIPDATRSEELAKVRDDNQRTVLYTAVKHGHLEVVKYLHGEHGACIHARAGQGQTPLLAAAHGGDFPIVQYLHERGAHIGMADDNGTTPLMVAAIEGHVDVLRYLHQEGGGDLEATDNKGSTLLHLACHTERLMSSTNRLDVVKYLALQKGVNIDATGKIGSTPLLLACLVGHLEVVQYLHEHHGASLVMKNVDLDTPLTAAVDQGHLGVLRYLHQHGGDIETNNYKDGLTPLHNAARLNHLDIVKYLVQQKSVNIDAKGKKGGYTPLFLACLFGHLEVVRYLQKQGSNVDMRNDLGITPLRAATQEGHVEILRYLHKHGGDIETKTNDGVTLLLAAACKGHLDVVKYLVKHGADVDARTKDNRTPLHLAAENGHKQVVLALMENRGISCGRDILGRTPLHLAAAANQEQVVLALMHEGFASADETDHDGQTPLHLAVVHNCLSVVCVLLRRKRRKYYLRKDGDPPPEPTYSVLSNPNIEDKYHRTPVHYAAAAGHVAALRILVAAFRDATLPQLVWGKWPASETPLHCAAENGRIEVVSHLIEEYDDDIEAKDHVRRTPLHRAAAKGEAGVVQYLVASGADITAKDEDGKTPLRHAADEGHTNTATFLLEAGSPREDQTFKISAVVLGKGAFGTVFQGQDNVCGTKVAVKTAYFGNAKDLAREFELMVKLRHPNIVKVLHIATDDSNTRVVETQVWMELAQGGSVTCPVKDEAMVRRYFQQALQGLEYLHSQNVIHRDIKPGNMLITDEGDRGGTLKLADFGLSKVIAPEKKGQASTALNAVCGTSPFMAPEIASGDGKYSFGSDLWALACSVLQMATGMPPWRLECPHLRGEGLRNYIKEHRDTHPSLEGAGGNFRMSDGLKGMLRRMLAPLAVNRGSATELLKADYFALGSPTTAFGSRGAEPAVDDTTSSLVEASTKKEASARSKSAAGGGVRGGDSQWPEWMVLLDIDDEDRGILVSEKITTEERFLDLDADDLRELGFKLGTRKELLKQIKVNRPE